MNRTWPLVGLILAAIIAANLTTAHWGPDWSIVNAFLLIGLIITTRDQLHDLWGEHRFRNMALLIACGSVVSYLASLWLASDALPNEVVRDIALASFAAFAVAETFDALTYHVLRKRQWLERSNLSNFVSATLDSAVFVTIAFGWDSVIILSQLGAKVAGGLLFTMAVQFHRERQLEAA